MEHIAESPSAPEEGEQLYQSALAMSARIAEMLRDLPASGGQPDTLALLESAQREQDRALERWLAHVRSEARKE